MSVSSSSSSSSSSSLVPFPQEVGGTIMDLRNGLSSQLLAALPALLYPALFSYRLKTFFSQRSIRRQPWPYLPLTHFSERSIFLIITHFLAFILLVVHLALFLFIIPLKYQDLQLILNNMTPIVIKVFELSCWILSLIALVNGIARNSRCNLNRSFWFLEFAASVFRLATNSSSCLYSRDCEEVQPAPFVLQVSFAIVSGVFVVDSAINLIWEIRYYDSTQTDDEDFKNYRPKFSVGTRVQEDKSAALNNTTVDEGSDDEGGLFLHSDIPASPMQAGVKTSKPSSYDTAEESPLIRVSFVRTSLADTSPGGVC
eukprot:TRINITY_DN4974_c0_g1_i1.p1 TRINITY_DN4974_c0_g1~~TRINITY_DN4974_c0_g1_i1.p1  ORF type:complete len:313 (+),score=53.84 TRINITY_DN4974_c0_g1_i1:999-1937(+)